MLAPVSLLLWLAPLLFVVECGYIYFARKHGLVEHKTQRSSHTEDNIVLGGGFIIPVAIWLSVFGGFHAPWVLGAITLVAVVSMTDDLRPLPDWFRLLVQIGAMVMVCMQLGFSNPWMWLIAVVIGVSIMNAFNFMDGINGMTVFYSIATLLPLAAVGALIYEPLVQLISYALIGVIVFGIFNCRHKPRSFAGDVGAVTLGLVVSISILACLRTNPSYIPPFEQFAFLISFVLVYGVDTALTLILRILKGENVREAHRSHLFQLLVNEAGYKPLIVSAVYAVVQILVDVVMVFCLLYKVLIPGFIGITVLLCIDYFYLRNRITGSVEESEC